MGSSISTSTPQTNDSFSGQDFSTPVQFGGGLQTSTSLPLASPVDALDLPADHQGNNFSDFDMLLDSINGTYSGGLSSFFVDQLSLPLHPAPLFPAFEQPPEPRKSRSNLSKLATPKVSAPHLFDEFTSTLPSFEVSPPLTARKEPWKITQQDWDVLFSGVQLFASSLPHGFFLPSRHTITRYITTYLTGFHRHLPMLHIPTFSGVRCPVELILAMATIGAQSAFDHHNAIMLFRASFAIAQERLRIRKDQRHYMVFRTRVGTSAQSPHNGNLPGPWSPAQNQSHAAGEDEIPEHFDPLPLAQTLLILMAMATWGNSEEIFDEAVGIQNILANYMRAEKLLDHQICRGSSWDIWIQEESFRRTVVIIFCFFVFHTIVYDLPPPILNSELNIKLPSREKDWEAESEEKWKEARNKHDPELLFQTQFSLLFLSNPETQAGYCSSLGSYTLILALIQHIYFLRTVAKRRSEGDQEITPADISEVEQALRNWQSAWNQDPESFLGPLSPLGPISFNSTALLRMAYIRLNVDLGPWRALNTHDPYAIAISMHRSPKITTSRKLSRAVLYSAHALSIPIKIGINIVTHNQAFSWSLQHSLCALECAFIISKWLIEIEPHISEGAIDEEDARLYAYIVDMVTEAEAGGESRISGSDLCPRVIRIWARILSGKAVWNVVRMIGQILEAYAQILEQGA
ncbi:hypothetical protein N7532_010252 [Penicillium argentinense]|uniref:Xylanolytic transcriptional activator regulatory domain-containing protein n=1 Tax=Penicillium argentinense TaxID=1131581 RepID=A0A9W9EPJ0_9EURO|nr:uncharacterized protein N7532_010252 [Penicillium argentinense]KAJ5085481.1 hypothetical protein N7532_010252 [Penicillium argentinense]